MLWVIEISKIFEKKTENTNKIEKIYKNVRIILRLHAKQDKIYCIQENNRGYIMEKIYETYGKIYQEIIPNTPYTPIKNIILHFEKYDYRFHWNRDNSVIEIWIPIQD